MGGNDERGDYKAVPLEEDLVASKRTSSTELPSSPSAFSDFKHRVLSTEHVESGSMVHRILLHIIYSYDCY
jgi:hypothetical protein